MAFWIVGFDSQTCIIKVLDNTDNRLKWFYVYELNNTLQNNCHVDINYEEESIPKQGKYIGITENGRTCLGHNNNGYYVFDSYKRLIVMADTKTLFVEPNFLEGFGITDLASTHYLYLKWHDMFVRCYNLGNPDYQLYGARGVYVDNSFQRLSKFVLWYEDQPNCKFRTEAKLEIDKDLLGKRYYGTDSSILLPKQLNSKLGKLNDVKTDVLPRFCSPHGDIIYIYVNGVQIQNAIMDTSYKPAFYENLVIDFMDSRGITEWKYRNSMEDVGRLWVTAKSVFFSSNKRLCEQSLWKGWIIKDYYDRLLDAFDVKITDWGLYEDH